MPVPQAAFWRLAGFAAALAIGSAVAQEQPAAAPKPAAPSVQPVSSGEQQSEQAELRARLDRRLADAKAQQERLENALKRLEAGAPLDEVRSLADLDRGSRPGGDRSFRPDGPRGDSRRTRGGPPPKLDNAAVLAFLDQHNPETAKRMRDAAKESPELADRLVGRLEPHIREALAERDPQTRELRIAKLKNGWELMDASRRFSDALRRESSPESLEEVQGQIRSLLGGYFDIQVQLRQREVAGLESRLAEIRTELDGRLSKKDDFVAERLDQIVRFTKERHERSRSEDRQGPKSPPPQK